MNERYIVSHMVRPNGLIDAYDWGVTEILPTRKEYTVLSWLTKQQAEALCAAMNDIAGLDWYERHPEWLVEANRLRDEYRDAAAAKREVKP